MKPLFILVGGILSAIAGGAAAAPSPNRVTIYDSTELAFDSHVVTERVGIGSWRSAFGIRGYRDEASARNAILAEAARVGADGVINLYCLGQTDGIFSSSGFYCYGNAIKLKESAQPVGK